jgi:pilus assembly protein CpaC
MQHEPQQPATWRRTRQAFRASLLILAVAGPATVFTQAPVTPASQVAPAPEPINLIVGRSTVLNAGAPITRVSLTNPEIADALVTGPAQLIVHGKTPGTISMFVWFRTGEIRRFEISVLNDIVLLQDELRRLFPGQSIAVEGNGRNVVLSGTAATPAIAEQAVDLAAGFVENEEAVVNLLQVLPPPPNQRVLIRVRFAEVSRTAMTELGSTFFTGPGGLQGEGDLGQLTTQQFPVPVYDPLDRGAIPPGDAPPRQLFSDFLNLFLFNNRFNVGAVISALKQRGLFQSLAEPNLVADSGKEASFLAGGEFPIPIAQGAAGSIAITIQYKEFGVRLNFTPEVVEDRIRLRLAPEVSALDFNNAILLQGFRIPALTTRRAVTEVELTNGQTFAIAGLLNNSMTSTMRKVPGIGDIPILGALFRSKAAQKEQTELVVMITPEILPPASFGVTPDLPRQHEPYLGPLPEDESVPADPPAFRRGPVIGGGATSLFPSASGAAASPPAADRASPPARGASPAGPAVATPSDEPRIAGAIEVTKTNKDKP